MFYMCVCVFTWCCHMFPEFPMGLSKDTGYSKTAVIGPQFFDKPWMLLGWLYFRQSLTGKIREICEKSVGNTVWLMIQTPGKSWNHDKTYCKSSGSFGSYEYVGIETNILEITKKSTVAVCALQPVAPLVLFSCCSTGVRIAQFGSKWITNRMSSKRKKNIGFVCESEPYPLVNKHRPWESPIFNGN